MMNSNQLRARFLEYFQAAGHTVVPSSPLVPANDPTLLFTNAGMVQFKDVFTGREKRAYTRAASSQKCVRAGGKHNDLENVGYTARHHTFFEMLGNFSFGDYFKEDAIRFAWEFITGAEWLAIPKNRLLVTIYHSDDEAYALWHDKIGVPADRIVRIGDKSGGGSDNFWQMGETGPCGPCTEIFYDHDPDGSKGIEGGPPGSPDEDGDRWIEIWNLVFMQFDRAPDGTLTPLPAPSVDTGMGLERVSAVMQGVHNNYDIDVFRNLIAAIEKVSINKQYVNSLRVVADHIRATCFLIVDGVLPSNEGRGYVLRRIMRRAMRHGEKLGVTGNFFWRFVEPLAKEMGDAYPELIEKRLKIEEVIKLEEERFAQTLSSGMDLFEGKMTQIGGDTIPGSLAFLLHDTYGFPIDLTVDIARERGLKIDMEGYAHAMKEQQDRSRSSGSFSVDYSRNTAKIEAKSEFTGYEQQAHAAKITAIIRAGQPVEQIEAGDDAVVFLDLTPFYAESGGQVGDAGVLTAPGTRFSVSDTQALNPDARGHIGKLDAGRLRVGDAVKVEIDTARRAAIMRNHSATHLLHAALRTVLGTHVTQKGSLVAPARLRFDFSHDKPVTPAEIEQIENIVNQQVLANVAGETKLSTYDEAVADGAMALFGEKYGDVVRVLKFGDFSTELCGGTHVSRTGDIGLFKIVAESGVAAGVRRIEAVTGENALALLRELDARLREAAALLRGGRDEIVEKTQALLDRNKQLERELTQIKGKLASNTGGELLAQAQDVGGTKVLIAAIESDGGDLRPLLDQLKNKLGSGIVLLGAVVGEKVSLIAGVTADLTTKVKAGELVNVAAARVGGKGGGRPDMAQAGGTKPADLPAALDAARVWVSSKLAS
ncbi:MAG: alanine--tRNA ligase [Nevskia sp.]|nr:alanine--tRNA ligase [Nevskia sp.]